MKKIAALVFAAFLAFAATAQAGGLTILRDEETEQALKSMSRPVFEQAGLAPNDVRFIIVNDSSLNAFVAGGQNIFIHTGLVLETETAEELLGVIAHEAGHIASGHLFRGRNEAAGLSIQAFLANLLGIAVAIGTQTPGAGIAIGSASNTIAMRTLLRHTRTDEGSADQAGVRFLRSANLPITGLLGFMKKLESQELLPESQQSEYVRTHPLTQDRVEAVQHAVDTSPPGSSPPEWKELHQRMKAKLLGYLFPDKALLVKDESIAARYGRAQAHFRKGQSEKALAEMAGLLKAEPKNPYFHELRGQILFDAGKIEEAVKAYAEAAALAPLSALIRLSYAQSLLESKQDKAARLNEAIKQLTAALDIEKRISEPHRMLAIAYGKRGQEGLSRLHLAEEALMLGKPDFAKREATLAMANLQKSTPAYLRAEDIKTAAETAEKRKKKEE